MRVVTRDAIFSALEKLLVDINTKLQPDVLDAIHKARDASQGTGALFMEDIVSNATLAEQQQLPLCQDTGMVVVFAQVGIGCRLEEPLQNTVNACIAKTYLSAGYRPSVVGDPLERCNTGDNSPAIVYIDLIQGDAIVLEVMVKGFGSENMSRSAMLTPAHGYTGIKDFVVNTVKSAGGNPCPPIIVGVGVGGTFDYCALMSKKALLRPLGSLHPESVWAEREQELLSCINALGIGPGGAGGGPTALGVHIEHAPTHIAGLPVAVNILCHSSRHGRLVL